LLGRKIRGVLAYALARHRDGSLLRQYIGSVENIVFMR
jgi:hypothetical protein